MKDLEDVFVSRITNLLIVAGSNIIIFYYH